MLAKAPLQELRQLLQSLISDIARHFEDEEQLLEECAFGGLEAHRQEHARLLEQADNWLRSSQNGMPLLADVFNFRITSYNVCYTKLLRVFELVVGKSATDVVS